MASEEPKRTEAKEAEAEAGGQEQPKVRNCFFLHKVEKYQIQISCFLLHYYIQH